MPPRRQKLSALPPLPTRVHSLLGPWEVTLVKTVSIAGTQLKGKEEAAGLCDKATRTISIDESFNLLGQYQVLGHELAHVWIYDGGADSTITSKQQEVICDSFGTWFASAIRSGFLTVDPSKA